MSESPPPLALPLTSSVNPPPKENKERDRERDQLNELTFENLRLAVQDLQSDHPSSGPVLAKVIELLTAFEIARDYQSERITRETRGQSRFKVR